MRTYKIVVFVPEADGERLRGAMGEAGAGRIGNYAHCSFTDRGIGRFQPLAGANPAVGQIGRPEEVVEERIEMLCADDRLRDCPRRDPARASLGGTGDRCLPARRDRITAPSWDGSSASATHRLA